MGHFVEHLLVTVHVFEDCTGASGAVVDGMVLVVHPDEVVGAVVLSVSIEMMADIIGLSNAPESRTHKDVYIASCIRDFNKWVQFTAFWVGF